MTRDGDAILARRRLLVASALAGLAATSCDALNPFKPCLSIDPAAPPASATSPGAVGSAPAPSASVGAPAKPGLGPMTIAEPPGLTARPVVAVYEKDPWAMVIGSDVPSFVLYDDGQVIDSPRTGEPPGRARARTTAGPALAKRLFELLSPEPDRRSLSHSTDQPSTAFLIRTGDGWIHRSVYGMSQGCKPTGPDAQPVPPRVRDACAAIANLSLTDRAPWAAERIEVMLWGFSHSRLSPKAWPAGVPPPPSRAPPERGIVKHVISAKHEPALRAFLKSLEPNQAVAHAGHKWSVRTRAVVPADDFLAKIRGDTWRRYAEHERGNRR